MGITVNNASNSLVDHLYASAQSYGKSVLIISSQILIGVMVFAPLAIKPPSFHAGHPNFNQKLFETYSTGMLSSILSVVTLHLLRKFDPQVAARQFSNAIPRPVNAQLVQLAVTRAENILTFCGVYFTLGTVNYLYRPFLVTMSEYFG